MIKIYLIKMVQVLKANSELNIFELVKWTGPDWFFRFDFLLWFRFFLKGLLARYWTWLWFIVIVIEENSIIDSFEIVITKHAEARWSNISTRKSLNQELLPFFRKIPRLTNVGDPVLILFRIKYLWSCLFFRNRFDFSLLLLFDDGFR